MDHITPAAVEAKCSARVDTAGKFDAELAVVEAYQKANALPGLLETLQHMQNAKACMRLPQEQEKAYDTVFAGFREMFFGRAG